MNRPRQWDWTCGHKAGAMCLECHRLLALRAHELAVENLALRQKHEMSLDKLRQIGGESLATLIAKLDELIARAPTPANLRNAALNLAISELEWCAEIVESHGMAFKTADQIHDRINDLRQRVDHVEKNHR